MTSQDPAEGSEDEPAKPTLLSLGTSRRTLAIVVGAFVLILGVPAALFAFAGRVDLALGLLGLFALMVLATGYAFREAVEAQQAMMGSRDEEDGDGEDT